MKELLYISRKMGYGEFSYMKIKLNNKSIGTNGALMFVFWKERYSIAIVKVIINKL